MTDNIYLNIAIGLIFVYLLYSLFASTVMELIATLFAYRHRMLERAIEQMLDGKSISYYWWDKVINFFSFLLNYRKFRAGKTNLIYDPDAGATSGFLDKQNLLHIAANRFSAVKKLDNQTAANTNRVFRIKLNEKARLFAACFTEHPQFRRSAEQTLFYKKPAYISEKAFSDILIDILSEYAAGQVKLYELKERITNSNFLREAGMNEGLRHILLQFINQSKSMEEFRGKVETWFTETMNRVNGWYKKQSACILLVIGFVLSCVMNASTIQIAHTISENKSIREKLVEMAVQQAKDTTIVHRSLSGQVDTTITAGGIHHVIDSVYRAEAGGLNKTLSVGWNPSTINQKLSGTGCCSAFINRHLLLLKAVNITCRVFSDGRLFLGILLTSLAISLGAPFWFDLLNKFINFRVAGKKPDDTKPVK